MAEKEKYLIKIQGKLIEVSEDVYYAQQCIENYCQIVNITIIELYVFLICAKITLKKRCCYVERYHDHGKKIDQRE